MSTVRVWIRKVYFYRMAAAFFLVPLLCFPRFLDNYGTVKRILIYLFTLGIIFAWLAEASIADAFPSYRRSFVSAFSIDDLGERRRYVLSFRYGNFKRVCLTSRVKLKKIRNN
jgi:hypothetical protein